MILKRYISLSDYSIIAFAALFLFFYRSCEPNIKYVGFDGIPIDVKNAVLPDSAGFAVLYSYKFKFKNNSIKPGYIKKIEPFLDSINTSKIEIYSCWINNKKISPFETAEIQIDIIASSDNLNTFLSDKGYFKISFYDNYNNLIQVRKSNSKASIKLNYMSRAIDSVYGLTKAKGHYAY